jgi:SAM-dependent methyltransferase
MRDYEPSDYGKFWADIYDDLFGDRPDNETTVAVLSQLAAGSRALEFGIGTGRIAIPLAQRGIEVHGIDLSQEMVDKLRAKPGGKDIPVIIGDCTEVRAEGLFSVVYFLYTSFYFLTSQEAQLRCCENAARHLQPKGVFVIEGFVHDRLRFQRNQNVSLAGMSSGFVDLHISQHDPVNQIIDVQHVILSPAGIQLRPNRIRYVWPSELDMMARVAGLRLRERWADWSGAPFTADSSFQIAIYEKP